MCFLIVSLKFLIIFCVLLGADTDTDITQHNTFPFSDEVHYCLLKCIYNSQIILVLHTCLVIMARPSK